MQQGFVWSNCSTPKCQPSCKEPNPTCVSSECVEGCACPEGKVLEDGECIDLDECPCYLYGEKYQDGEVAKKDCNLW